MSLQKYSRLLFSRLTDRFALHLQCDCSARSFGRPWRHFQDRLSQNLTFTRQHALGRKGLFSGSKGAITRLLNGLPIVKKSLFLLLPLALSAESDFTPVPAEAQLQSSSSLAAPKPPTILSREPASNTSVRRSLSGQSATAGLTLYSIGDPTDEEQLYLEFINRARANPAGEALRFQTSTDADVVEALQDFSVNLLSLVLQFSLIAPAPPLSMNANLTAAARLHSQDMLANSFQGHDSSNGSSTGDRITAQGYDWTLLGENVYSHARSVWHGHAGFNVDWGGNASTGGIQDPPGHRITIHNASYREVGIGVVSGTNAGVGPQLVTQDFANRRGLEPFITGVVYYDVNGNNFYDLGEGIEGVTVLASGSQFYGVTASSGGYSVPVPGNGTYTVTFQMPGLPQAQKTVTVTGNNNVKLDHLRAYVPPVITGSDRPFAGRGNSYAFGLVGGAKAYQWKQSKRVSFSPGEGAETGLDKVTAVTTSGYDVISSVVKASGNHSFHLAHPDGEDQILTLNRILRIGQSSQLTFAKRLGFATAQQVARAQVSLDGGRTWQDVWSEPGPGAIAVAQFERQSVSLARFAGNEIALRFLYEMRVGQYFQDTDPEVGLYLDDIAISHAEELVDQIITDVTDGFSFVFRPADASAYALQVRAKVGRNFLAWGPPFLVTAQPGGPIEASLRITSIQNLSAGGLQIEFEASGSAGSAYQLESARNVTGPWSVDTSAAIEELVTNARYRAVTAPTSELRRFFRARVR